MPILYICTYPILWVEGSMTRMDRTYKWSSPFQSRALRLCSSHITGWALTNEGPIKPREQLQQTRSGGHGRSRTKDHTTRSQGNQALEKGFRQVSPKWMSDQVSAKAFARVFINFGGSQMRITNVDWRKSRGCRALIGCKLGNRMASQNGSGFWQPTGKLSSE